MKNINEKFVAVEISEKLKNSIDVFDREIDAEHAVAERNADIVRFEFSGDEEEWLNDPYSPGWVLMSWNEFARDYPEEAELYLEDN